MKAILVMEMPESCIECPVWEANFDRCRALDRYTDVYEQGAGQDSRPDWCPLKPMPERKIELERQRFYMGEYTQGIDVPIPENKGWNACIDAIEGSKV